MLRSRCMGMGPVRTLIPRITMHIPIVSRRPERRITEGSAPDQPAIAEEPQRFPKKKVALLLAYVGTNFSGLQRNPGVHTVEDALEGAIYQSGGMLAANLGRLQNARRAIIYTLNMQLRPSEALETMRKRVNSFLPADVRVLGMERTTRSFTPRHPTSREYHYLLPLEAFSYNGTLGERESLTRMREIMSLFRGTNNFHNYTNRRLPRDPSCSRYIIEASVDEPLDSFVRVRITGQSFMNHQIRKMIGTAVAVIRQDAPLSVISASFGTPMQWLPTAPPGFLVKMRSDYATYNQRWAGTHNGQYVRQSLDFLAAATESREFEAMLLRHIRSLNEATHPFREWIDSELREPVQFDKVLRGVATRTSSKMHPSELELDNIDGDDEGPEEVDPDEVPDRREREEAPK